MRARLVGMVALSAAIALPSAMVGAGTASAAPAATVQAQALKTARDALSVVNTVAPQTLAAVRAAKADKDKGKGKGKDGTNKGVDGATPSTNPKISETCGLDATLTLDSSGSIGSAASNVRNAAYDFLAALKDTNSTLRILNFATWANQLAARAPVNAQTTGSGGSLSNGVAAYPKPNGGTNWMDGLDETRRSDSTKPELLIFITDGDPTYWVKANKQLGGTGQTTSGNIADSLPYAITAANNVKNAGTRILVVGVGNGLTSGSSQQRLMDISGPQIVTNAQGLAGKTINQVDVAAFKEFEALGAFLRSVVTSLCGNSVTVQKLAQSSADAQYLPATGWDVTVKPTVTGGYSWVEPAGDDNTPQTRSTAGAQGSAAFQWKPKSPSNSASVEVSEKVNDNFTANRWECDVKKPDGTSERVGGKLTQGSPKFSFDMASSDVAACRLYNDFNYSPDMTLTKVANDDPVRGNGVGWNETYVFTVRNTGNTPLNVSPPVDPDCVSISGPTGPGSGDPNPRLAPGDSWLYTCAAKIGPAGYPTSPTSKSHTNEVNVVAVAPNSAVVTREAAVTVGVKTPGIKIVKSAKKANGDPIIGDDPVPAGSEVTYEYSVSNIGNDTLNLTRASAVVDDKCGTAQYISGDLNNNQKLEVTETWLYRCVDRLLPSSEQSTVTNIATVTSTWSNPQQREQNNQPVTDQDSKTIKVIRAANLRVIKSTNPGNVDQDFSFTVSSSPNDPFLPPADRSFVLNTDQQGSRNIITDPTRPDAPAGTTYTVTETDIPTGWDLTGVSCAITPFDGTPSTITSLTAQIEVPLEAGDDATCTFTNERKPILRVSKATPDGSDTFHFTATDLSLASFDMVANSDPVVLRRTDPGTSSVTEVLTVPPGPAGWQLDDISCNLDPSEYTVSGATVTMDLIYGDDVSCVFTNSEIPDASITVVKSGTTGVTSPDFPFSITGSGVVTPGVVGTVSFANKVGETTTRTVRPQAGGTTYSVVEDVAAPATDGWDLQDPLECEVIDADGVRRTVTGTASDGTISLPLHPGDDATCTYVNLRTPRLTIVKEVVSTDSPGKTFDFEFTKPPYPDPSPFAFTLGNADAESFSNLGVDEGFTVEELDETDWTLTGLECSGPGSSRVDVVDLDLQTLKSTNGLHYGDDVMCTFINTDDALLQATIYVLKNTDPSGDPAVFDFGLTGPGVSRQPSSLSDGESDAVVVTPGPNPGGTYELTEELKQGWRIEDITCRVDSDPVVIIDGDPDTGVVTIPDLTAGEVAVCVYENQRLSSLTVTKATDSGDFDFPFTVSGPGISPDPDEIVLRDGESKTYGGLIAENANTVTITESVPTTPPDRWVLSDIVCTDGSTPDIGQGSVEVIIAAGVDVECTFVDSQVEPATVQVVKVADPADGTGFGFTAAGQDPGSVDPADASFTLRPDGDVDSRSVTVYPRADGEAFTFTENIAEHEPDWRLLSIECDNAGEPPIVGSGNSVIIPDLLPGSTWTCTFTNRENSSLTVLKEAVDDPTVAFPFDWSLLEPFGPGLRNQETRQELIPAGSLPNSFSVEELLDDPSFPADWYLSGPDGEHPSCVGMTSADYNVDPGSVDLSIDAGQQVVCTFANFFDYRPSMQLVKTVDKPIVIEGGTVTYTYTLTNTGNTSLTGDRSSAVTDDRCAPVTFVSGAPSAVTLAPEESWEYECVSALADTTYNTGTATMTGPDGPFEVTDDETVEVLVPALELLKQADKPVVYPGTQVTYTYELGNVGATNYRGPAAHDGWIVDDKCTPRYVSGDTDEDLVMTPGEVWVFECTAVLTGTTTNTASTPTSPTPITPFIPENPDESGPPAALSTQETVEVIDKGISLTKSASAPGASVVDGALSVRSGETVTYTYDVTSGAATTGMRVVSLVDDKCTPVEYKSGDTNANGLVDPSETWRYECRRAVDGVQRITNTAFVVALEPVLGGTATATAQATVQSYSSGIAVEKTPSRELVPTGTLVTYTYRVTNSGTMPLSGITVTDDKCAPVTYKSGDNGDGILTTDEVWIFECSATLNRTTVNAADAKGKDPSGAEVNATDSAQVVVFNPANLDAKIKVKKSANKDKVKKGKKVTYTYKVSNPGKVALAKVKKNVTDNKCSRVRYIKGDKDRNGILTLGPVRW